MVEILTTTIPLQTTVVPSSEQEQVGEVEHWTNGSSVQVVQTITGGMDWLVALLLRQSQALQFQNQMGVVEHRRRNERKSHSQKCVRRNGAANERITKPLDIRKETSLPVV
jgi:hypothetical protein